MITESPAFPNAVRTWKKVEAEAIRSFPSLRYFDFSPSLVPVPDFESAVNSSTSGDTTPLYDSLNQVIQQAAPGGYDGIVCLTDGLDTHPKAGPGGPLPRVRSKIMFRFILWLAKNHQAPHTTLLVREMNVPGQVLRKSQFTATILVEAPGP